MREIIFDTETTGFDPSSGDRLVEIGCIELMNRIPTGQSFHRYVDPERDVPQAAFAVHGLSAEFLSGHPKFGEIVTEFLDFVAGSPLVAHNAEFDMKFMNAELKRLGFPAIPMDHVVDTLAMARRQFPGAPATLDALCKRFNVDNSSRTKHGALLDAELLAEVYLELTGGRQVGMALVAEGGPKAQVAIKTERQYRAPRAHQPSAEELAAHEVFVATLAEAIWKK